MRNRFFGRIGTGRLATGALAFVVFAAAAAPAAAGAPSHGRITRGDVIAAFQARTTGGYQNILNGRFVGAPVRGFQDGRISFFAENTYCPADWHYLGVTLLGEGGRTAAAVYLADTSVTFTIDDSLVFPTVRTALKPFVGTGIRGQFGYSTGAFFAPESLALGQHTLQTDIFSSSGDDQINVTFWMDPAAC